MIFLIGAIALMILSIYTINKSHRLYVEEEGVVIKVVAVVYAVVSIASGYAAYHANLAFIGYLKDVL